MRSIEEQRRMVRLGEEAVAGPLGYFERQDALARLERDRAKLAELERAAGEACRHCGELHDVVPDDLCAAARREYDAVDRVIEGIGEGA